MAQFKEIALISDDLLFASQLKAVITRTGGTLAMAANSKVLGEVDAIFVDLNSAVEERIQTIADLRVRRPESTIIAFCHHAAREVRQQAMVAGASQVLANGGLQAAALRLSGGAASETVDG